MKYESILSASVIRAPVEDEYPGWLAATVSRVKGLAATPACPIFLYMPIPGPYVLRLPILPPSSHANSEQRARWGFLISWNYQEFWRLPPVMRTQSFAAVPTRFSQMETPMVFTTGGPSVAYYDRDQMYRSLWDAHSVTMGIRVTEYLVMACNRWFEEARDRSFWLFSDTLSGWVKQLKPEELTGDAAEALGIFQAMLTLWAALLVNNTAFHVAVRHLDTSRWDTDGWLMVVSRQDADGVGIFIQDPLEAAKFSIPASCTSPPPEARPGREQVPIASVGNPSGWASAVAQRTGTSGSSPLGGPPLSGHQLGLPPRASLVASRVTLVTTAPSTRADHVTPVVSTAAGVATANRLPMPPPVPEVLLQDNLATFGPEEEDWMERLVGRFCGPSPGFPTSSRLVSMLYLLESLSNDLFSWAETQAVGDLDALEAVSQGWSRSCVNEQLWRLPKIHEHPQESHLQRVEQASTWRARGSGACDRRDEAAGASEAWYRDAPGSPQRGTSGGGDQK